jgi:signal transduction histidine kinase/ActR/RegA family two-component response regulator
VRATTRLAVIVLGLGALAWPALAATGSKEARVAIVAADIDNFPYSYRDEKDGVLKGFAVDVFDAVARQIQLDFQRVELETLEGLQRFDKGEFDVGQFHPRIADSASAVHYSAPILVLHGAIFVRDGGPTVSSIADIAARRLRIATPTQGRIYAESRGIDPALITQASSQDCIDMLSRGEVDAILLTRLTGLIKARHLKVTNIRPIAAPVEGYKINYCFAAHQGARGEELVHALEDGLAVLQQTGEISDIYQKWFSHEDRNEFTLTEISASIAGALGIALVVMIWALMHQRHLRHRISRQTIELAEGRTILAEAQRFANLGHWQCRLGDPYSAQWSDETFRIFELDRSARPTALTGMAEFATPGDRSRWKAALVALAERAQPFDLVVTIEPRQGVRKTIHSRGRPVYDVSGQQTGVFGTVQDVTASHAAAEALRRSEQLLRALYGNLPIALGLIEESGSGWHIVSVNPEARRQLGLAEDPPAGSLFSTLGLAPRHLEFWTGLFSHSTAESRTIETEFTDEAHHRTYAITVFPVAAHESRHRCCFLSDDVTDRRRADAELAQGRRLRAVGELVGGIAHEFNNLLTPILLNAQILQSEWAHEPALRTELGTIADAARRSAELTHRLLAFGRKTDRTTAEVDFADVVQANANLVRSTIDRRISVRTTIAPDLPRIHLDASDLHQVIINLLLNARDALMDKLTGSPPSGWSPSIEISAQLQPPETTTPFDSSQPVPTAGWIDLQVSDNGCGMKPEVVERIFEPFYSTKEVGKGTGLGLATVWHAVSEMGGRIEVASTYGTGTTFRVFLPVRTSPAPAPAAAAAPAVVTDAAAAGRQLLLVEDEQPISRVVRSLLQRRGHTVTCAADGRQGWAEFSAQPNRFDAIILDLDMPGISGQEFARRARELGYTRPIIVVSGRITEADRHLLSELQISQFVNKPFESEALYAAVDEALSVSTAATTR